MSYIARPSPSPLSPPSDLCVHAIWSMMIVRSWRPTATMCCATDVLDLLFESYLGDWLKSLESFVIYVFW